MSDDTPVTAAFDGGRLTPDGGVMLLAAAERRLAIADRLAGLIADPRGPALVTHTIADNGELARIPGRCAALGPAPKADAV